MQTQAQGLWTKVPPPRKYETSVMYKVSLWASSPIWASEPSFSSRVRTARASTFHDSPQMESLFAGEYRIGLFSLSWILQSSQEKSKTMVMPNFGGVNKVLEMVNILGDDLQSREERGRKPALRIKNCCFFAHHAWLLGEKDDRSRFFFSQRIMNL